VEKSAKIYITRNELELPRSTVGPLRQNYYLMLIQPMETNSVCTSGVFLENGGSQSHAFVYGGTHWVVGSGTSDTMQTFFFYAPPGYGGHDEDGALYC